MKTGNRMLEAANVMTGGVVTHIKLSEEECLQMLTEAITELRTVDEIMRLYVFYALTRKGNNKCHTADAVGVNRRTIQRWLRDALRQAG
jgi:hypothetical protein